MADRELLRGAEYWRDRGEKARTFAEQMREKRANETMLQIANGYDRLAPNSPVTALSRTILGL